MFPIYWDDLTDEEKMSGKVIMLTTDEIIAADTPFSITATPTDDWRIAGTGWGDDNPAGEPQTMTVTSIDGVLAFGADAIAPPPEFMTVSVTIVINGQGPK